MQPDARLLARSDIVCTTPEKWDGVSRDWRQRPFVSDVALIVIDEVHLLGEERGPGELEVNVTFVCEIAELCCSVGGDCVAYASHCVANATADSLCRIVDCARE